MGQVVYSSPERGPITMLVYYVGYWLPAALVGRILGWGVANFILFLWTWFGVLLTVLHLNLKLKTSLVCTCFPMGFDHLAHRDVQQRASPRCHPFIGRYPSGTRHCRRSTAGADEDPQYFGFRRDPQRAYRYDPL